MDDITVNCIEFKLMAESRPRLDEIASDRTGSKTLLFAKEKKNILDARTLDSLYLRYIQENESASIIKQAVIQALKGGVTHVQTKTKESRQHPAKWLMLQLE